MLTHTARLPRLTRVHGNHKCTNSPFHRAFLIYQEVIDVKVIIHETIVFHLLSGYFWQVSDFHYDANYSVNGDPNKMCHKSSHNSTKNIGNYGNYLCDAPWKLITSAIEAMYRIHPNPDSILWTG